MAENKPRWFQGSAGFSALGSVWPNSRCWLVGLFLELLGSYHSQGHPRCWQNPLPCGCRPEVCFLAGCYPPVCPGSLSPSPSKPAMPGGVTFSGSLPPPLCPLSFLPNTPLHLCPTLLPPLLRLRAHGIAMLTQITQDKFPLLGSVC